MKYQTRLTVDLCCRSQTTKLTRVALASRRVVSSKRTHNLQPVTRNPSN